MKVKRKGILGRILFYGILPLFVIVVMGGFLLNLMDIPVLKTLKDVGNKLPVIGNVIADQETEQASTENPQDYWEQQFLISEEEVEEKNQKIAELDQELVTYQKTIEDLTKSYEELQVEVENKNKPDLEEQQSNVAGIYENLSASKAAAILEAMPPVEASITISQLDIEKQGELLGKMKDVKKAAQLTMLLKEISMLTVTDQASLKEQVQQLIKDQENPTVTLAETIEGMAPSQSAGIIQSMMSSNSTVAMNLIKTVNTNSRSQILSEIAKLDAKLAADITAQLNN